MSTLPLSRLSLEASASVLVWSVTCCDGTKCNGKESLAIIVGRIRLTFFVFFRINWLIVSFCFDESFGWVRAGVIFFSVNSDYDLCRKNHGRGTDDSDSIQRNTSSALVITHCERHYKSYSVVCWVGTTLVLVVVVLFGRDKGGSPHRVSGVGRNGGDALTPKSEGCLPSETSLIRSTPQKRGSSQMRR